MLIALIAMYVLAGYTVAMMGGLPVITTKKEFVKASFWFLVAMLIWPLAAVVVTIDEFSTLAFK